MYVWFLDNGLDIFLGLTFKFRLFQPFQLRTNHKQFPKCMFESESEWSQNIIQLTYISLPLSVARVSDSKIASVRQILLIRSYLVSAFIIYYLYSGLSWFVRNNQFRNVFSLYQNLSVLRSHCISHIADSIRTRPRFTLIQSKEFKIKYNLMRT